MENRHNPILTAEQLVKSFPSEDGGDLTILDDVSLSIGEGEIIAIIGSSGSGKSTLLHLLGGLDRPDSGAVLWGDKRIDRLLDEELAEKRNHEIGFVFQFHHLLPEFTALENVMMPALIDNMAMEEASDRAKSLLQDFGVSERASHRPSQLSGGEQQRVSLARALMNKPKLILADEPTGNLDQTNTENVLARLFQLREEYGVSLVLVTHERDIAGRADSVYELDRGKIRTLSY